jgi:hypothetical protein
MEKKHSNGGYKSCTERFVSLFLMFFSLFLA